MTDKHLRDLTCPMCGAGINKGIVQNVLTDNITMFFHCRANCKPRWGVKIEYPNAKAYYFARNIYKEYHPLEY